MKAEWRDHIWERDQHPERQGDYLSYRELVSPDGVVIAKIEQFSTNQRCFYASTPIERSGCLGSADWARQWCEMQTKNKVN